MKQTFGYYLKERKGSSFWNPFNLPRYFWFFIPFLYTAKEGFLWTIIEEFIVLLVLYIFYFPQRNKIVVKEKPQIYKELKPTAKDKELFHDKKDIYKFLVFSVVIVLGSFLLFYLFKL